MILENCLIQTAAQASQDKAAVAAEIQTTEPKPEYEKIVKKR